jgi:AcrR family transcriptional regulator
VQKVAAVTLRRARTKRAYHHGNLRQDLVTAALDIINKSGLEALTLRAVGQRLGVSQAAPYRHFASKEALLAAVAADGFATLLEQVRRAMAAAGTGPVQRYEAIATAYMRFALAHRDHFRVMYGPRLDSEEVAVPERRAAFALLTEAIEACQSAGLARPGPARVIAIEAWSYAHGLATLYLDRLLHRSIDERALIELARHITVFLGRS